MVLSEYVAENGPGARKYACGLDRIINVRYESNLGLCYRDCDMSGYLLSRCRLHRRPIHCKFGRGREEFGVHDNIWFT